MKFYKKVKNKKLQFSSNQEAEYLLAIPSRKIDQWKSLTGGEMFHFDHSQIIEQSRKLIGKIIQVKNMEQNKQNNENLRKKAS